MNQEWQVRICWNYEFLRPPQARDISLLLPCLNQVGFAPYRRSAVVIMYVLANNEANAKAEALELLQITLLELELPLVAAYEAPAATDDQLDREIQENLGTTVFTYS